LSNAYKRPSAARNNLFCVFFEQNKHLKNGKLNWLQYTEKKLPVAANVFKYLIHKNICAPIVMSFWLHLYNGDM